MSLLLSGCGNEAYDDLEKEYNADGTEKVDTSTLSDIFNKDLYSTLAANAHDTYEFTATENALIEIQTSWEPSQTKSPHFDVEVYVGEDLIESSYTAYGSHQSTVALHAEEGNKYTIKVINTSENSYDYNLFLANTINSINMTELTINKEQNGTANDVNSYYQMYYFTAEEESDASFSISWKKNSTDSVSFELYLYSDNTLLKSASKAYGATKTVLETDLTAGNSYSLLVKAYDTNSKDYNYTLESAIYNTTTNTQTIDATTSYSSTLNDTTNRYQLYTFTAKEDGELYSYVTWDEVSTYSTNLSLYIYEDGNYLTSDYDSYGVEYNAIRQKISAGKFYSILVEATHTNEKEMPYTFQTALSYKTDNMKTLDFNTTTTGLLNRSTQLIDTYSFTTDTEQNIALDLNWSKDSTSGTNIDILLYDNGYLLSYDTNSYGVEYNGITFDAKVSHNYTVQLINDTVYTKDLDYNLIAH